MIRKAAALLSASGVVLANRALLRVGLRRPVDGWRRATGLLLRDEASTFYLSAFGLDVWSDVPGGSARSLLETQAHAADRLVGFLTAETGCHVGVKHGELEDHAETIGRPSFTLAFHPPVEGLRRFVAPQDWSGERAGGPDSPADSAVLLNIVCRVTTTGHADIWMRVNHAGADGVPMQEMLSRLETAWGVQGGVLFPSPEAFAPFAVPRPLAGRPDLREVQMFLDFTPLLEWRKRENARLAEPMTLSAAMLWRLARHGEFSDLHFGTTVETEASRGLARGVGVVVVRPAEYLRRTDGLPRFVADFNRRLDLTRRRASDGCKTLDAAAFIPAALARRLLRHALENVPRAFGSMGLTMLKDARVFGAPIAEAGHARGFVAVGGVGLPSSNGSKVGCVTVKGPTAVVSRYPTILARALAGGDTQAPLPSE